MKGTAVSNPTVPPISMIQENTSRSALAHRRARIEPTRSADYPTAAQRPLNSRLNCARLQRDWQITLPSWETALQQCLNDVPYAQTEHAVPAAQSV